MKNNELCYDLRHTDFSHLIHVNYLIKRLLNYVIYYRFGVKKLKQQVDVIGLKNDQWMGQIVKEKLCKMTKQIKQAIIEIIIFDYLIDFSLKN